MKSSAAERWPVPGEPLPRGPHRLPRDVVVRSQRSRMLHALVEVVASKGYHAATVADIIGRAGVSRTTFYQQFKDKQDCFLVAYQRGADAHWRSVVEAVASAGDPPERLRRNLRAYLGELVVREIAEGRLARLAELEPVAVYLELALFGVPGAGAVLDGSG